MIQIGKTEAPVADKPIEHLVACHDRILARLATLERLGPNFESQPESALKALDNCVRFFDVSGRLHTEDEEQSVFPRMRPRLSPESLAYLDSLEGQHREKEQVYADLKSLAGEMRQGITTDRVERYRALVGRLCELYRSHIASENDILVRLGRENLTEQELEQIHAEMRARRK